MSVRLLVLLSGLSAVAGDTLFFKPHEPVNVASKQTNTGASANIVICPGGEQECPRGSTCCALRSGGYGCCPLLQAACCADHEHCCPHGTTCDTTEGKCNRGVLSFPWVTKTLASSRQNVQDVLCPDGRSMCPGGSTCCIMQSGEYGCCPMPKAVCCSDDLHCCPSGTTCDLPLGTCNSGSHSVPMVKKIPAVTQSQDVVCPGGESSCPTGSTCCVMQSGQYGCCPLPQAVCCSDHLHCCPSGTSCDVSHGKCNAEGGAVSVPWVRKSPALYTPKSQPSPTPSDRFVVCPDRRSSCPAGSTCCKMQSGEYGCFPLPKAVCCADHLHCCPSGTTCDTAEGKCQRGSVSLPWASKVPAIRTPYGAVGDVPCPDNATACMDGMTCCMMKTGSYGCCPLPQAVCCPDQIHCCPNGATCDSSGKCLGGPASLPLMRKISSNEQQQNVLAPKLPSAMSQQDVVCPDKQSICVAGSTCCITQSGGYGCCPLPDAVCCADHIHCCPEGSTCNTAIGTCTRSTMTTPWFKKKAAVPLEKQDSNEKCPDKVTMCPSGSTCCRLQTQQYACCPLPKAVCCSDGIHCCPEHTKCDMVHRTCKIRNGGNIAWSMKQPALPGYAANAVMSSVNIVVCPDGKSECPSGKSCCMLASGDYGCCPFPTGSVCCKDHLHCCPPGYTCNLSKKICEMMGIFRIPFEKSQLTSSVAVTPEHNEPQNTVFCPDPQYKCPDQQTCCKMGSGHWGCCPLPRAVCCADHVHCCPEGSRCDLVQQACVSTTDAVTTPWKIIQKIEKPLSVNKAVPCPGSKFKCPTDTTCCKSKTGLWACCPLADAVCCRDGIHCCPKGYTCDMKTASCSHGQLQFQWLLKNPAIKEEQETNEQEHFIPLQRKFPARTRITTDMLQEKAEVICPDKTSMCPSGSTCCLLPTKKWGCCPLLQAVCCIDHIHCCPQGATCDLHKGRCIMAKGDLSFSYSRVTSSVDVQWRIPVAGPGTAASQNRGFTMIICPDHEHECPDRSTCCRMARGGWGCCPFTGAVCCHDGEYCCPNGYICHMAMCIRGHHRVPATRKHLATLRKPAS